MRESDADDGADRPTNDSRRRFLGGTAGVLGAAALGSAFTGPAFAQDGNETEGDEEVPDPAAGIEDEFDDDVDLLNYLREVELLQVNFYGEAVENFDEDQLTEADPVADLGEPIQDGLLEDLETIQQHEQDHADVLATSVLILDGEPAEEPEFDFGDATEDPESFLETAVEIEDTAVGAYAGAAGFIENQDVILSPALSIHSVEARHASFVRTLSDEVAFPDAYDEALPRSDVEAVVEEYLAE